MHKPRNGPAVRAGISAEDTGTADTSADIMAATLTGHFTGPACFWGLFLFVPSRRND
nr:hypothetical protein [Candidatus Sigynarchaeota archaeon]